MELVEGKSLEENVKLGGRMESQRAVQMSLEVCRAIEHMAAKGLVHGDLWPRTVILLNEGGVKLAMGALGGARSADRFLIGGRHNYVAPERVGAGRPDIRADIYSAGGVLFYALTGQHPFTGVEPRAVLSPNYQGPVPDPRTVLPNLFTTVATVVCRAMARNPDERYRTPAEMVAALETAAAAIKPRATGTTHRPATRPVTRPSTRLGTPATRHLRIRRRRR
jgi:serine/threonine protein kinase